MKIEIQPEELEKIIKVFISTHHSSDSLSRDDVLEILSYRAKNSPSVKIETDSSLSDLIHEVFLKSHEQNT